MDASANEDDNGGSGGGGHTSDAAVMRGGSGAGGPATPPSVRDGSVIDATRAGDSTTAEAPRLLPPAGKIVLFIGQDVDAIKGYASSVASTFDGFTTYTSISENAQGLVQLEGLSQLANQGGGNVLAQALANTFPSAAVALGLYMVDHTGTNLEHVAGGTHDAAIDRLGDFLLSLQRPVFVRVGYEFDGTWNHYEPEPYKRAFRHISLRLRSKNTKLAFVWQSATYGDGRYRNLPLSAWYPGDDVVDWFGSSYFKFTSKPHQEMLAMAREHRKPLMIAEATPQGYDLTKLRSSSTGSRFDPKTGMQIWQEWFVPFFNFVYANEDVIRAVAYINTHWDAQPLWSPTAGNGYWGDSRVQANQTILTAWKQELLKPTWR